MTSLKSIKMGVNCKTEKRKMDEMDKRGQF